MAAWVFGIDGGGTSSRLRIESLDGRLLYRAEAGGTNLNSSPRDVVAATLASLFDSAYDSVSGLSPKDCAAGFAGSAGVDKASDRGAFVRLLQETSRVTCPLDSGNDAEVALVGALGDTEGLLLIAGTGSIAYARARDGSQARAGGWGHILGDEGSAYRISLDAVSRAFRSFEGRDLPTTLMREALAFFKADEPADLLPVFYAKFEKAAIARFARAVGRARDAGDALAVELFDKAALELAALVISVHERVGPKLGKKRLGLRGGLIEGDTSLRLAVERELILRIPGLEVATDGADAATGACALARSLLG